jgi:hypothetical protein
MSSALFGPGIYWSVIIAHSGKWDRPCNGSTRIAEDWRRWWLEWNVPQSLSSGIIPWTDCEMDTFMDTFISFHHTLHLSTSPGTFSVELKIHGNFSGISNSWISSPLTIQKRRLVYLNHYGRAVELTVKSVFSIAEFVGISSCREWV